MMYRLKKDLGDIKKGTVLQFIKGVFVSDGGAFDPMDVMSDTEHFEEHKPADVFSYVAAETV